MTVKISADGFLGALCFVVEKRAMTPVLCILYRRDMSIAPNKIVSMHHLEKGEIASQRRDADRPWLREIMDISEIQFPLL